MKSRGGEVVSGPLANHVCGLPNDAQLEVIKRTQSAKKRAREEETPLTKIHTDTLGDLHDRGKCY